MPRARRSRAPQTRRSRRAISDAAQPDPGVRLLPGDDVPHQPGAPLGGVLGRAARAGERPRPVAPADAAAGGAPEPDPELVVLPPGVPGPGPDPHPDDLLAGDLAARRRHRPGAPGRVVAHPGRPRGA